MIFSELYCFIIIYKITDINIREDPIIKTRFKILKLELRRSWNNNTKFKHGTNERTKDDEILIINAIIPGKNEINVNGVKALCASLKVLHLLATAMHTPAINIEYKTITNKTYDT